MLHSNGHVRSLTAELKIKTETRVVIRNPRDLTFWGVYAKTKIWDWGAYKALLSGG
jgi:hypothetical protein